MNVVEAVEQSVGVGMLKDVSRIDVAHQAMARAVDRIDALQVECRSAFEQLARAIEQMKTVGVETNVKMSFPLSEAWADWRAKQILKR